MSKVTKVVAAAIRFVAMVLVVVGLWGWRQVDRLLGVKPPTGNDAVGHALLSAVIIINTWRSMTGRPGRINFGAPAAPPSPTAAPPASPPPTTSVRPEKRPSRSFKGPYPRRVR